jgi:hypothetical protein
MSLSPRGFRRRAPSGGSCWDDVIGWNELIQCGFIR